MSTSDADGGPSSPNYSRLSLDADRREIRILSLLPGQGSDPVCCTLEVASIDSNPEFEALSYVWGDPDITAPIVVEGGEFLVTTNLEFGLRCLRLLSKPRLLWVDAICIDQGNVSEKSKQIPLMSVIYQRAADVVVWLGKANPNIELALEWVEEIANGRSLPITKDLSALPAEHFDLEANALMGALSGMLDILENAYWTRIWTFQEYRLPKQPPLCVFDTCSFRGSDRQFASFDTLINEAIRDLNKFFTEFSCLVKRMEHDSCGKESAFVGSSAVLGQKKAQIEVSEETLREKREALDVLNAQNAQLKAQSKATAALVKMATALGQLLVRQKVLLGQGSHLKSLSLLGKSGGRDALSWILTKTSSHNCSLPHDKFYAVLSLVPESLGHVEVDYRKDANTVRLEVTRYIVNCENGLRGLALRIRGLPENRLRDRSYPSWAPDFSIFGKDERYLTRKPGYLETRSATSGALGRIKPIFEHGRIMPDLATLRVFGRVAGTCVFRKKLAEYDARGEGVRKDLSALVRGGGDEALRPLRRSDALADDAAVVKQDFRGICSMIYEVSYTSIHMSAADLGAFLAWEAPDELEDDDIEIPEETLVNIRHNLRKLSGLVLFVTDTGLRGFGVSDVEEGDVVTICPEIGIPYVMRREEGDDEADGKEYWRLVGGSSIDGLMDNDGLDMDLVEKALKAPMREFLVH